jgi:hypothetical protein
MKQERKRNFYLATPLGEERNNVQIFLNYLCGGAISTLCAKVVIIIKHGPHDVFARITMLIELLGDLHNLECKNSRRARERKRQVCAAH